MISPYIIAILTAWVLAHVIKYIIGQINGESYGFRSNLFRSGGMPSAHTATVVALASVIGLINGLESAIFSVAALFSLIVMYDAMKVRRSAGEIGIAVTAIIKEQKSSVKKPFFAMGHTTLEVFFGAILGAIIGAVVFFATK